MRQFLYAKWGGQQAEGERDREKDDFQDAVDCYADDAEGEQEEPDKWVGDQSQESQGPAEYEEDAPEQEREHRDLPWMMIRMGIG
jgi:hypothetical protein